MAPRSPTPQESAQTRADSLRVRRSGSRYPPAVAFGNCARSATVPVRSPNDARRPLHVATTPPLVASAVGSKNADWSRGASVASAATVARVRVAVLVA